MGKPILVALVAALCLRVPAWAQSTVRNDDSCDVTVAPAATLLLPFFDIDLSRTTGQETTLLTITNVTSSPQIARVTVWTDWAFPVLTFNLFLTGYDVQTINLYDVLARGQIAPGGPGTSSTWDAISPNALVAGFVADPGSQPGFNSTNPNIPNAAVLPGGPCAGGNLPGMLRPELVAAMKTALTTGLYNIAGTTTGCGTRRVGGTHTNARGYVTIDVAADCRDTMPTDPAYYSTQILFDNVLIGDYQQVTGDTGVGNFAQSSPMVHIRAVPEGGPAGSQAATNLPYTFYDRYTPASNRKMDRRVPLPSQFAVRWIEDAALNTNYKIWREGIGVGATTSTCSGAALNSYMMLQIPQVIRFDERENSFALVPHITCSPICGPNYPGHPATSITSTTNTSFYPAHSISPDVAGWMYLDLDHRKFGRPSQNWVIASFYARGRYSVDFDAAQLGNGCSPAAAIVPPPRVGPSGGVFPCPPGVVCPP